MSTEQAPAGQQDNIFDSIHVAFERAKEYLASFKKFLQIYWEYSNLDYDHLMNEDLAKPRVIFRSLLMLLDYHNSYLEQTVPFQADIGLFRINTLELK